MKTRIWAALCVAASLVLVACGPSPAARKEAAAKARQERLAWSTRTVADAYEAAGHTDLQWNESARAALAEFARARANHLDTNEDFAAIISNNCANAMTAGCNDPMIHYLYARYCLSWTEDSKKYTASLCQAATELENSTYPNLLKFYAWLRAGQQITDTYGYGTNVPADLHAMQTWKHAGMNFITALGDKTMPPEDVYEASHEMLKPWEWESNDYVQIYQTIQSEVADERAKTAPMLLLQGEYYTQMAWLARGSGYANTVTPDGWKQFAKNLAMAEKTLTKAWQLDPEDPRIALRMMTVVLGQSGGRNQMELWFNRCMKLDPNDYDACDSKLQFLEPKWYGSVQDMLAFGHECVTNVFWGGHVPLILMDAHIAIQQQYAEGPLKTNYWSQPEVWADLKSAFDRFFEENPNEISWYHNYAWYAYQAGDWKAFNELVPKLGPINYNYFGGKDRFDKMVAYAKAQAVQTQGKN